VVKKSNSQTLSNSIFLQAPSLKNKLIKERPVFAKPRLPEEKSLSPQTWMKNMLEPIRAKAEFLDRFFKTQENREDASCYILRRIEQKSKAHLIKHNEKSGSAERTTNPETPKPSACRKLFSNKP